MARFATCCVALALTVALGAGVSVAPALADDPVPTTTTTTTTTTEPAPTTTSTTQTQPPPSSTPAPPPSGNPPTTTTTGSGPVPDDRPDLGVTTAFDKPSYTGSDLVRITVTITNAGQGDATNVRAVTAGDVDVGDTWGELREWRPGVLIKPGETRVVELSGHIRNAVDHTIMIGGTIVTAADDLNDEDNRVFARAEVRDSTGTFAGRIFQDKNANGVQDAGEGGLAGVTISISGGVPWRQLEHTTDADGRFSFAGIPTGQYSVYYTAPPPWTVYGITGQSSESIVVDAVKYADVRMSAVRYLSYSLQVGFYFDHPTYQPQDQTRLIVVLANSAEYPLSGVTVDCSAGEDSPGLRGGAGWGPLAKGGSGVTIPARGTKSIEVSEPVPRASVRWGYVRADCSFGANFHPDHSWAQDSARVPGNVTSASGTIYQERGGNSWFDEGEGIADATVVLSDPDTGAEVARARTEGDGRFTVDGVPAGKYDLRVVGLWKPSWSVGWFEFWVVDGMSYWNNQFEVVPGTEQENKRAKLVGTAVFDRPAYNSGDRVRVHLTLKNLGEVPVTGVNLTAFGGPPAMSYDWNQLGDFRSPGPGARLEAGAVRELDLDGTITDPASGIVVFGGMFTGPSGRFDFWSSGFRALSRVTATHGTYAGILFGDKNNNGVPDEGEALGRVPIKLSGGVPYGTFLETTRPDGRFAFRHIPTGRYSVIYHLTGGWTVPSGDLYIDEKDHGEVLVRAMRPLPETLLASVKFTKDSYKARDRAHLTVHLTNTGPYEITGITALCSGAGNGNEIANLEPGWGPLAYLGTGVTLPAGRSRTFDVWSEVPDGAYSMGYVVAGCLFYAPPLWTDGPMASAKAKVPGGIGTSGGRVLYDADDDYRTPAQAVADTKVVLVDPDTGGVVARAMTDARGHFVFRDLPANRYEFRVIGPWKVVSFDWLYIGAGKTVDNYEMWVIPGARQPDPDAPPVNNDQPAPREGVAPPVARQLATTGATVIQLSIVGLVVFVLGLGMVLVYGRRRRA